MPAVLVSPHTPVEYYAEHAGELAYLCAATRLTLNLRWLEGRFDMPTAQADAQPGPGAVARVIEYAPGRLAGLPPHTTLEIIENPQAIPVPGAAYYGWGLLTWQGRRLPMIDLEALVRAYPGARHATVPGMHWWSLISGHRVCRSNMARSA